MALTRMRRDDMAGGNRLTPHPAATANGGTPMRIGLPTLPPLPDAGQPRLWRVPAGRGIAAPPEPEPARCSPPP